MAKSEKFVQKILKSEKSECKIIEKSIYPSIYGNFGIYGITGIIESDSTETAVMTVITEKTSAENDITAQAVSFLNGLGFKIVDCWFDGVTVGDFADFGFNVSGDYNKLLNVVCLEFTE